MLLICHFGGKTKRPRSAANADSSDSETELELAARHAESRRGGNANATGGAITSEQRFYQGAESRVFAPDLTGNGSLYQIIMIELARRCNTNVSSKAHNLFFFYA
ncbi:unnamed protein product [Ceratitis capitata]|uniref:(Mediterranean fruit fly) hypothetical protein n=1 Tax=Ceratitis capitata TaxID=7213 RepID=A0A811VB99_CERCA|nr:unnamed protein product [Ceratitis capitata]